LSSFTNSPGYLSSIETVAPTSSDSGSGKAADAKATGTALYTGFTEWKFSGLPDGWSVESFTYEVGVWNIVINNGTDHGGGSTYPAGAYTEDSVVVNVNVNTSSGLYNVTATRHLITPTKTS